MKKQKFLNDLHATQDQELIDSFEEKLGINTEVGHFTSTYIILCLLYSDDYWYM